MADINKYASKSGRMIKEDGTLVNIANLIEGIAANQGVSGNTTSYKLAAEPLPTGAQEKDMCISIGDDGVDKVYVYLQGQWREM